MWHIFGRVNYLKLGLYTSISENSLKYIEYLLAPYYCASKLHQLCQACYKSAASIILTTLNTNQAIHLSKLKS